MGRKDQNSPLLPIPHVVFAPPVPVPPASREGLLGHPPPRLGVLGETLPWGAPELLGPPRPAPAWLTPPGVKDWAGLLSGHLLLEISPRPLSAPSHLGDKFPIWEEITPPLPHWGCRISPPSAMVGSDHTHSPQPWGIPASGSSELER